MQIERRSLAFRAARAAKVKPTPSAPITRILDSLSIEEGFSMLSFNPPKFHKKKDGTLKELKWKLRFLLCQISRDPEPFKIMRRTDAATILKHSRRIQSRCGSDAANEFETEALSFLSEYGKQSEPEPKRIPIGWHVAASGRDCKRGAHTASRIVPLEYISPS